MSKKTNHAIEAGLTCTCPSCKYEFPLEEALRDRIKQESAEELQVERAKIQAARKSLEREQESWDEKLKVVEAKATANARKQLEKEYADKDSEREAALKEQADERVMAAEARAKELAEQKAADNQRQHETAIDDLRKQLNEANEAKVRLLEKETELLTLRGKLTAEITERVEEAKRKELAEQASNFEIAHKKHEEQLRQANENADKLKRQLEQGSQQLQGEAQELVLQDWLAREFLHDLIDEVAKGARGGDVKQRVMAQGRDCGLILYESKNAQHWSNEWIPKLKEDGRNLKAAALILVTRVMPRGRDTAYFDDGVWVCRFAELRVLAFAIRQRLEKVTEAVTYNTDTGDKMKMLYDYMYSDEFVHQISGAMEALQEMQNDLNDEIKWLIKKQKKREKQIERVIYGIAAFYGSVKGIGGGNIASIPLLEDGEEEDELE